MTSLGPVQQLWLRRTLLIATLVVGVVLLALTAHLLTPLFSSAVVRPSDTKARVPAHDYRVWDSLAVQEGRTKPFQSACTEAVRQITGRSRFEGLDPVAVVLAWMLAGGEATDDGTAWKTYPFILCAHHDLRRAIYEHLSDDQLSPTQKTSQHIAPADLRASPGFDRLLATVAGKRKELQGRAHLELDTVHLKAEEVGRRLVLFDALCGKPATPLYKNALAGERFLELREYADIEDTTPEEALARTVRKLPRLADPFHLVPLDRVPGSGWFSLAELRALKRDPSQWPGQLARRLRETPQRYLGPEPKEALDALWENIRSGRKAELLKEVESDLADRRKLALRRLETASRDGNQAEVNRLLVTFLASAEDQQRFVEAQARHAKAPGTLSAPLLDELRTIGQEADRRVLDRLEKSLDRAQAGALGDAEQRLLELDYLEARFPTLYRDAAQVQPFPQARADAVLTAFDAVRAAYKSGSAEQFDQASHEFFKTIAQAGEAIEPYPGVGTIDWEITFNRLQPFLWSWITMLAALILLAVSLVSGKRLWYAAGLTAYAASLAMQVYGFTLRIAISGRAPVSNMYETVIFVAFMSALFALLLELIYRKNVFALAGAAVSTLGLVLADQLPVALDPKISPMVPVLRTNYWLTVHVLTIVSSYAGGTLAWGLGNLTLVLLVFGKAQPDTVKALGHYTYRALQIAVLLLASGTFLGGWWAAESWGRFWGWDPKEVGALIALVCYVIPLHARYLGWIKDLGLAVSAILCYASILLSWYVVNFMVASGLHSYGFGAGGAAWVLWASLLNIEWLLVALLLLARKTEPAAPGS